MAAAPGMGGQQYATPDGRPVLRHGQRVPDPVDVAEPSGLKLAHDTLVLGAQEGLDLRFQGVEVRFRSLELECYVVRYGQDLTSEHDDIVHVGALLARLAYR